MATRPPAEPTIADYIRQAGEATAEANRLQAEADAAKAQARAAYDAVFDELARLKGEAKDIDTFRSSKLGKLLQNIPDVRP